jgi:hypothetical protein
MGMLLELWIPNCGFYWKVILGDYWFEDIVVDIDECVVLVVLNCYGLFV